MRFHERTKGYLQMKRYQIFSLVGAALLVLSGCVGMVDTDTVSMMKSKGSAFQTALHKEYTALAVAENMEGDDADAEYFISKARMAAEGKDVVPQPMAERNIPAAAKGDLAKARLNLSKKLWSGAGEKTPAAAAKAQAMYDCWLQEQEENNQPKDIAACRSGFEEAYAKLGTMPKMAAKPMMKAKPAPLPAPFIVYFASDSSEIDGKGMVKIKQAFADYRLHKPGKVWVAGHTDTKGSKTYNEGLSRHRANAVGNALMELGVPRKAVEKARHGEVSQAKPTKDNVAEAMNRRVSIFFMR